MQRTALILALVAALCACATRKPPPEPSGKYRPVNGAEQKGMTKPYERVPCAANPKMLSC